MPSLTRAAVRLALLALVIGTSFGALILLAKGTFSASILWSLLPAHIELVLLGWTLQFALAGAYWILPRHPHGRKRGRESLMWAGVILLNLGILIAIWGQLHPGLEILTAVGRTLELAGAGLAISQLWTRVKPAGR
jgi:hypothetical protein